MVEVLVCDGISLPSLENSRIIGALHWLRPRNSAQLGPAPTVGL
jgi:hypothetical protein